jgi:hypothetical protein
MTTTDNIFKEALTLSPSQKAQLIDKLISSLDKSAREIDELWAKEAEDRIDAYDRGFGWVGKRRGEKRIIPAG